MKIQTLIFIGNKKSFVGKLLVKKFKKKNIKLLFFNKNKNLLKNFIKKQKKTIDFLWTNFGVPIDTEIINIINNPKLVIISQTTGLNHINFDRKKFSKIKILSLKNDHEFLKSVPSTAEHAFALFLVLIKNIIPSFNDVKKMNWRRGLFLGLEAKGLNFGIIGNGRIGKILGKFAKNFGMNVLYFDIKKTKSKNSLNELLSKSDVVSLNVDYNFKNRNFINMYHFNKMKKNSYFINTSRGENINQKDLIFALKNKKIAGAALDVLTDDSLWYNKIPTNCREIINFSKKNNNLIITSHLGGYTRQAIENTFNRIVSKLFKIKK